MTNRENSRDWALQTAREFSDSGWATVEVRTPEVSILLTDGSTPLATLNSAPVAQPVPQQIPQAAPSVAPATAASTQVDAPVAAPETVPSNPATVGVTAPGVGVFWSRPKPGEPPFVEPGAAVEPGQTVGLLEVMKMFTEITSDKSGVVAEVLADGTFVEFGQPVLQLVEQAG